MQLSSNLIYINPNNYIYRDRFHDYVRNASEWESMHIKASLKRAIEGLYFNEILLKEGVKRKRKNEKNLKNEKHVF